MLKLRRHILIAVSVTAALACSAPTVASAATPPDTVITARPPEFVHEKVATISYKIVEAGQPYKSFFHCSLDGGAWGPCEPGRKDVPMTSGSYTTPPLPDGRHTLQVKANDWALFDPTPASVSWTVASNVPIPDTTITSGPASITREKTATVAFKGSLTGLPYTSFWCALDNGTMFACSKVGVSSGSYTTPALADGQHTLKVWAFNGYFADQTPAVKTWTVAANVPVPDTTITSAPSGNVSGPATVTFKMNLTGLPYTSFLCSLDNAPSSACSKVGVSSGSFTTGTLPPGFHTLKVWAVNGYFPDPTPASASWNVTSTSTGGGGLDGIPSIQVGYRVGGSAAGAYNELVPSGVSTDSASGTIVSQMLKDMSSDRVGLIETSPLYTAKTSDAVYQITVTEPWDGKVTKLKWRIPSNAGTSGQYDSPIVVYDPAARDLDSSLPALAELRLWRATINHSAKTISAQGYGIFDYSRASDGKPLRGWGAGNGLSIDTQLIRASDVASGEIKHALRIATPNYTSGNFRAPAQKSDQGGSSPLQMGMRFQLDPSVNCNTRTVPGKSASGPETRYLRMICVALQRYGMIVSDGAGGEDQWQIQAEDNRTANWAAVAGSPPNGIWGNIIRDYHANSTGDGLNRSSTDGIPFDKMRVLSRSTFS